jgi:hypothetical protein
MGGGHARPPGLDKGSGLDRSTFVLGRDGVQTPRHDPQPAVESSGRRRLGRTTAVTCSSSWDRATTVALWRIMYRFRSSKARAIMSMPPAGWNMADWSA